jgi:methyl-accepting chemotaxis protein
MSVAASNYTFREEQADYDTFYKQLPEAQKNIEEVSKIIETSTDENVTKLSEELNSIRQNLESFKASFQNTKNFIDSTNAAFETVHINAGKIGSNIVSIGTALNKIGYQTTDPTVAARAHRFSDAVFPLPGISATFEHTFRLAVTNRRLDIMMKVLPEVDAFVVYMKKMDSEITSPEIKATFAEMYKSIDMAVKSIGILIENLTKLENENKEQQRFATILTEAANEISNRATHTTLEFSNSLYSNMSLSQKLVIVFVILLLLTGVASLLFLNHNVIGKIQGFVCIMHDFTAGDADLTKRIAISSSDELGKLGVYLNDFVDKLQAILKHVRESSDDVASGNTELAAAMEQLSSTFNMQSEQISAVATNLGEMDSSSKEILDNLSQNLSETKAAKDGVSEGGANLRKVMDMMKEVEAQTERLSSTISSLVGSSSQIGEILNVINDIADQTNLLALNAAIEAARAGDAGRGFAVVADEVRKLAERTQKSTSEIASIINSLQRESANASKEMEKTAEGLAGGLDSITNTNVIMLDVVNSTNNVTENTNKISDDIQNQFKMMTTVTDNTQALASGVEQSVQMVTELSATVMHLQKQAENLKFIVSQFKI